MSVKRALFRILPPRLQPLARSAHARLQERRWRLRLHIEIWRTQHGLVRASYPALALLRRRGALRAPGVAAPLHVRFGTSDPYVFHQVFVEGELEPVADVRDVRLVIDCGANVGYSSAWFASRFPDARVVAVEPDPANAALCRRNVAPYGERVRVVECGVWSHRTGLRLVRPRHSYGDAWVVQVREAGPGEDSEVDAVDIGTLLDESGEPRIDVLKVDIEGAERVVFAQNTDAWLPRTRNIVVETHGAEAQAVVSSALEPYEYTLGHAVDMSIVRDLRPRETD